MRREKSRLAEQAGFYLILFAACVASAAAATAQSATPTNAPAAQTSQPAAAQSPDTPLPSFEVASVKKHVEQQGSGMGMRGMGAPPGDTSHWMASGVTAKFLIGTAYSMKPFQIIGGPSWMNSDLFDIEAKIDDSLAQQLQSLPQAQQQAQEALMLRSLLADRFKLQVTRATKEGNVLALVVAKGGPKLKEVPPPDPNAGPPPPIRPGPHGEPPELAPGQDTFGFGAGLITIRANALPLSKLVDLLSRIMGKSVLDQTGLKGTYQYSLEFGQDGLATSLPPNFQAPPGSDQPSLFTALQDQLGLKLESTKGPIETITIDHIEEPSEN
jgi:uncharacterized protein (TIGR03435 family)